MEEKQILKALKEIKQSTKEISRMIQLLLYNLYGEDQDDSSGEKFKLNNSINNLNFENWKGYLG